MLQTPIPTPPLPQANHDDDDVDFIGNGRARVAWNDEIHNVAEAVLASALASADYGEAGGRSIYGNQSGRELLEERHDMKERMKRLEDKLTKETTSRQNEIAGLQYHVTDLQHHVKDLKLASEGYRRIRNRFINVYRRDVLGYVTHQEHQQISDGNNAAHGGDAVADASLYTSGERHDEGVLIKLYGLSANQISYQAKAGHTDSITAINAGATWRAKGPNNIPQDVAAAFTTFVNALSMNPDESATDGTTPLSRPYYAFWAAHREGLRRSGQRVA